MEFLKNLQGFRKDETRNSMIEALDYAFDMNAPELKIRSFFEQRKALDAKGKVYVIGFGKAAKRMYEGAHCYLGSRIASACVIIPSHPGENLDYPFLPGDHPLPSTESLKSSALLIDSLKNLSRNDLVIALISGGGSSMFEVLKEGVKLDQYNSTISCLMKNGATIKEINAIRYLFSKTKGGGLLRYTYPAKVLGVIVSDVPGDDVNIVASGPTADPQDSSLVYRTISKFGKKCRISRPEIRQEREPYRSENENNIILKNSDFVRSIKEKLEMGGYEVLSLGSGIEGNTATVARGIVAAMRAHYEKVNAPFSIVGGGETSTEFVKRGIGGRNLELCLRFLMEIKEGEEFAFGSFGTDGMDGSSKAMGAIVDNQSLGSLGREYVKRTLSESESLAPLELTGDVVYTGFTGTNVADVFIGRYDKSK